MIQIYLTPEDLSEIVYGFEHRFTAPQRNQEGSAESSMSASKEQWVWTRTYTNYPLHLLKMERIAMGAYPLSSPNRFDLASVRAEMIQGDGRADLDQVVGNVSRRSEFLLSRSAVILRRFALR